MIFFFFFLGGGGGGGGGWHIREGGGTLPIPGGVQLAIWLSCFRKDTKNFRTFMDILLT